MKRRPPKLDAPKKADMSTDTPKGSPINLRKLKTMLDRPINHKASC